MKIQYNKKALKLLGKRINEIRKQQKLSQMQLAFEIGTTQKQISLIELGKVNTSIAHLFAISEAMNISIKELFEND